MQLITFDNGANEHTKKSHIEIEPSMSYGGSECFENDKKYHVDVL